MPGNHAVADHQGEEVGAEDAEDAADRSADQALQADQAQPPFEQDDSQADNRAYSGVQSCRQLKRVNQVTGNSNNENK